MVRSLLRHDRAIVLTVLFAVAFAAWAWLLLGAGMRPTGSGSMMSMAPAWTAGYAILVFNMWAGMMLAMMLPAAAPAIAMVTALMRTRDADRVLGATGLFALGYVVVWLGFSLLATAAQWGLGRIGWLSAGMASNNATLTGLLLIAAGIWQWTRFKRACLAGCRSPVEALAKFWRRGVAGPLLSGASHGAYCLGCCWLLMALLFVGGVMNLAWIALIALLVLVEKTLPFGAVAGRVGGVAFAAAGAVVLFLQHSPAAP